MSGIGITIVLVYLAIGAMLWALWLHPLDQARDIPLLIVTWPREIARIARSICAYPGERQ